jgi:hypothetical protein
MSTDSACAVEVAATSAHAPIWWGRVADFFGYVTALY